MTPNELRTAADDLDRLEELEPRPGRISLADRLRRGAEWVETVERVKSKRRNMSDCWCGEVHDMEAGLDVSAAWQRFWHILLLELRIPKVVDWLAGRLRS